MTGRKNSLWFSYKGVRSDAMGLRVIALPDIPVAEERGEVVTIPGRDGTLFVSDGAYEDVSLYFVIEYTNDADRNAIAGWLSGYGELYTSAESEKCYHARCVSGYSLQAGVYARGNYRAEIMFKANPFLYEIGSPALPDMTQSTTVAGQGNIYSRPIITVYGNGDIHLLINSNTVLLEDVEEYVTLDCEAMMAYKDDENRSPYIVFVDDGDVDEWPSLRPYGQNNFIDWYDDDDTSHLHVSKVVIKPNWRWR